jgi:nucleoid DNA-binding protein
VSQCLQNFDNFATYNARSKESKWFSRVRGRRLAVKQRSPPVISEPLRVGPAAPGTPVKSGMFAVMTRTDLIDRIADSTGRTKKEADDIIGIVLSEISDALARGEKVDLRGFGTFQVTSKPERQGRNIPGRVSR